MPAPSEARRARTPAELSERLARFISPEGLRRAEAFRPRPTDVIIATYPKAGTTWMQQIVHGLRTRGDMDFDEITEVTPWIELAHDVGWDLDAEQRASPRAYKSHWNADQVPPGCRYVAVIRDPRDTMVSFHRFLNGWFVERDAISLDDFVTYLVEREHHAGDYWSHLLSWWRRRAEPAVRLFTYEDLVADLEPAVRRVAELMGLASDEQAIQVATRQARFDFMKAHEPRFDDHLVAAARNLACGLPPDARSTKVASGRVGDHAGRLSSETLERLERRWQQVVTPATGHRSYASLRTALSAASR